MKNWNSRQNFLLVEVHTLSYSSYGKWEQNDFDWYCQFFSQNIFSIYRTMPWKTKVPTCYTFLLSLSSWLLHDCIRKHYQQTNINIDLIWMGLFWALNLGTINTCKLVYKTIMAVLTAIWCKWLEERGRWQRQSTALDPFEWIRCPWIQGRVLYVSSFHRSEFDHLLSAHFRV